MGVVQLARNLPDSGRRVSPSPIICRLVLPEAPLVQSRHFFYLATIFWSLETEPHRRLILWQRRSRIFSTQRPGRMNI